MVSRPEDCPATHPKKRRAESPTTTVKSNELLEIKINTNVHRRTKEYLLEFYFYSTFDFLFILL